jgi:hypothetical protein
LTDVVDDGERGLQVDAGVRRWQVGLKPGEHLAPLVEVVALDPAEGAAVWFRQVGRGLGRLVPVALHGRLAAQDQLADPTGLDVVAGGVDHAASVNSRACRPLLSGLALTCSTSA